MKAIYCEKCHDIVLLTTVRRDCRCGNCSGKYLNSTAAITNGMGKAMAFGTGDFASGLGSLRASPKDESRDFYMQHCKLRYVWFRPHSGLGNPHTGVVDSKKPDWPYGVLPENFNASLENVDEKQTENT